MNKTLKLAIIAQALLDIIEDVNEREVESAFEYLQAYPEILRRLRRAQPQLSVWKREIERAMGR